MSTRIRIAANVLVLFPTLALLGCATILGGGPQQPVSFNSDPTGADFSVKSSSGLQMASGKTPQTVRLPRKNEYQIDFTVPGYQRQSIALAKGVNGWIWGNLVLGWIIGFGVDFLTGSAYKLEPSQVQVSLARQPGENGQLELVGIVRQLDEQGRVIREQRVVLKAAPIY
jgi:hypothetical protein